MDRSLGKGRKWLALECGNPESEYYRSLVNITETGGMRDRPIWTGCEEGRGV